MKKKNLGLLLSILFMVVAIVLWFVLPALKSEGLLTEHTVSFLDLAFGKSETLLGVTVEVIKLSVLNVAALVLLAVSLVYSLLAFFSKKGLVNPKTDKMVILLVSFAGAALLFLTKTFAQPVIENSLKDYQLAYGVYVVASLALVSGVTPLLVDKKL